VRELDRQGPHPHMRLTPPCPACRGQGTERRWVYDEESSALEETLRVCRACGGTGRLPPRIEVRPGAPPPTWAWGLGPLT